MYMRGTVKKLLNWPFLQGKYLYYDKRKHPKASTKVHNRERKKNRIDMVSAKEAQEQERRVKIARDREWGSESN